MSGSNIRRGAWCVAALGLSLAATAAYAPNLGTFAHIKGATTTAYRSTAKAATLHSNSIHRAAKTVRAAGVQAPAVTFPTISGNIAPNAIEIENGVSGDATKIGTNLYPINQQGSDPLTSIAFFAADPLATFLGFGASALSNTPILNLDSNVNYVDWIHDTIVNSDTGSVTDGVATGIITGVSGTTYSGQKRGHWWGGRVVDGIAGADQDIFIKGGKEDDTSTWTVGGGSVGSSKYDITQAYIANTRYATSDTTNFPTGFKNVLYFAMERRGNNGTTAFDFEFDQLPPLSQYVPNRTDGDVLFTFEMNGSGSSGSATPHIYVYHTSDHSFLNHELTGTSTIPVARRPVSNINQTTTPSAPWGYVNSQGNWTIGQIPNFSVAEAAVPFGIDFLTGVNGCGGHAYVQVRTRSSVTNTSDLKDTTSFFQYSFGGPTAGLALQSNCGQTFSYSASGSHDSQGGGNLTYDWTFQVPSGVTLTSADIVQDPLDATKYHAEFTSDAVRNISVVLPAGVGYADVTATVKVTEGVGCTDQTLTHTVRVWQTLDVTPTFTPACNSRDIAYGSTVTGGNSPYTYTWTFYKKGTPDTVVGTSSTASGTFTPTVDGDYYATLRIDDTADTSTDTVVTAKGSCNVTKTTSVVTVNGPMNPAATKFSSDGSALTATLKVTYAAPATVQWQKYVGGHWVNISGATGDTYTYSDFETDDTAPVATSYTIGSDSYVGKVYTVKFRAITTRSGNGGCSSTSNEVTLKKSIGVDP